VNNLSSTTKQKYEGSTGNTRLRLVAAAILATICLLGLIEIYSATKGSSLAGMHMRQVRWLVIGFVAMFALSRLDYHLILDQAPILYLIGVTSLWPSCWSATLVWCQTLDSNPWRISSGVRTGQIT